MTNCITAISALAITKFTHLLRVLWRNLPGLAGKAVHVIDRAVLAYEAYSITAVELCPALVTAFCRGFSWGVVGGAI